MKKIGRALLNFFRPRKEIDYREQYKNISIEKCFHYLGCHYSIRSGINPYLDYLVNFSIDRDAARECFVNFLMMHRPATLNQAYSLDLEHNYPLWQYPWQNSILEVGNAWHIDPEDCPDILTHYSERGILKFRIEQEFYWLERAFALIKNNGYKPEKYGYVKLLEFSEADKPSTFLVLDGNHRVSAMKAMGHENIVAEIVSVISADEINDWVGVLSRAYSINDARKIFQHMANPVKKLSLSSSSLCEVVNDYRFE